MMGRGVVGFAFIIVAVLIGVLLSSICCDGQGDRPVVIEDGPQQGCMSLDQVEAYLRNTAKYASAIAKIKEIGKSVEDRPLTALCIGASCSMEDGKMDEEVGDVPEAFFNGMHHSRECVSMMSLLYGIQRIVEGFEENEPWAVHIIHTRRIWFLPLVNPDGYAWNEKTHPSGGGMHRKNRRTGECSHLEKLGVDLNRNYPVCFENKDGGASTNPCEEDYKGKIPFSEPETQAIKQFVEENNFTVALNMHSYGRLMLLPYSCQKMGYPPNEDNQFYLRYGDQLAMANHFTVGRSYEKKIDLYFVNGDAADWMYREHKIFAISPEVGGGGFWAPKKEVKQYSEENVPMLIQSALFSGTLLQIHYALITVTSDKIVLEFTVENAGLWHSKGDVVVTGFVDHEKELVQPVRRKLGVLNHKYHFKDISMEIAHDQTKNILGTMKGLKLHVHDSVHCVGYYIKNSEFPSLSSNHQQTNITFVNHAFATRYLSTSDDCLSQLMTTSFIEGGDDQVDEGEEAKTGTGTKTKTKTEAPTKEEEREDPKASFREWSEAIRGSAFLVLLGGSLIVCCCGVVLIRSKPRDQYNPIVQQESEMVRV